MDLETAIALAVVAHKGQVDKAGKPYILHPLRVMNKLEDEYDMITGVLHDTVEDCDVTLDDLRKAGFHEDIVYAVDCVSRRTGESYKNFIGRVMTDKRAIRVKIADIEDNLQVCRMAMIDSEKFSKFTNNIKMYVESYTKLKERLKLLK
jgi:(p)ppGpp synthase/HD superfamily hydrolase